MESKSYKEIGNIPLEFQDEEILDRVIELYGQFKSKKQINELLTKELELEELISSVIIGILISRAKVKIRETLKVADPKDYKGRIIYFLEILLGGKAKHRDKLKALEMLAVYTGVDIAVAETPQEYAKKVADAIKQMDESIGGGVLPPKEKVSLTSE